MILSALFVVSVALEVFLFIGKDYVLNTRRRVALEATLRQTYADLQESKKRIAARRAGLIAAIDDAEQQLSDLREADKAFESSRKVFPTLIHMVGETDIGVHFRAPVSKQLPAAPDASQRIIWTCKNFIDVWAYDSEEARRTVAKQFQFEQGYDVGELVAVETQAPTALQEAAA
ncbi:MAG TPA: hypothetical protein VGB82_07830 [Alphaproteobacteria bacterium]